jgi:hypothetical protein
MGLRRVALIAICMALTVPLFAATIPPLLDDPHRLAPMAVLAAAGPDADLAQLYAIDFRIAPNLGMDMIVPLLAQIMPLTLAGKLFLALALILPLLGTVALHDAIFEKRSWWPLAAAIIVYNAAFLAGFLNFAIGIGLTLLGAACWVRLRHDARRQILAGAAIAAALFFIHAFAAFVLLIIIAGFESHSNPARIQFATKLCLAALPATLLYLYAWLAADTAASPHALVESLWSAVVPFDAVHKAIGAAASFFTYDPASDLLILIAVTAALAALSLARKLAFAWPAAIAPILLLAYAIVPSTVTGTGSIDAHLPVLAGFLLFAGITPKRLGRRETAVLGLAFAALMMARLGVITLAWQGQRADLAHIAALPPHAVKATACAHATISPDRLN